VQRAGERKERGLLNRLLERGGRRRALCEQRLEAAVTLSPPS